MKDTFNIKGVICPMVTPFDEENRIDFGSARRVVDFLVSKGIAALNRALCFVAAHAEK